MRRPDRVPAGGGQMSSNFFHGSRFAMRELYQTEDAASISRIIICSHTFC